MRLAKAPPPPPCESLRESDAALQPGNDEVEAHLTGTRMSLAFLPHCPCVFVFADLMCNRAVVWEVWREVCSKRGVNRKRRICKLYYRDRAPHMFYPIARNRRKDGPNFMTRHELREIVSHHRDWLRGEREGISADSHGASLRGNFGQITRNLGRQGSLYRVPLRGHPMSAGR